MTNFVPRTDLEKEEERRQLISEAKSLPTIVSVRPVQSDLVRRPNKNLFPVDARKVPGDLAWCQYLRSMES